jgi:hypothetical protein
MEREKWLSSAKYEYLFHRFGPLSLVVRSNPVS